MDFTFRQPLRRNGDNCFAYNRQWLIRSFGSLQLPVNLTAFEAVGYGAQDPDRHPQPDGENGQNKMHDMTGLIVGSLGDEALFGHGVSPSLFFRAHGPCE